jgi:hypothetical protein
MVRQVDEDSSGEIDFEEFCSLMVECMRVDHDGSMFDALGNAGKLEETEQRAKDSGAKIMWDPGYPGENDVGSRGGDRYGAVVYNKDTDSYTFA